MMTPVVLITGALIGVGRATALAFAREDARVVGSGRRDEEGRRWVAALREFGGDVEFFRADVRRERRRAELGRRCRRGGMSVAMPWT